MIKKLLILNLIVASLNVLCAETKAVVEFKENYAEANLENLKYLYKAFVDAGLPTNALHDLTFDYLKEYKCVNSFSTSAQKACSLPNDNLALMFGNQIQIHAMNGNLIRILRDETVYIVRLVCSLEDKFLATALINEIKIWDMDSGKCLKTFTPLATPIISMSYLGHNKLALISIFSDFVTIMDTVTGKIFQELNICGIPLTLCLLNPQNLDEAEETIKIAVNSLIGKVQTIQIWDIYSGKCLKTFEHDVKEGGCLCKLPKGKFALSGDENIRIYDATSKNTLNVLRGHSDRVTSMCLLSNNLLASTCKGGKIMIWNIDTGNCEQVLNTTSTSMLLRSLTNGKFASLEMTAQFAKIEKIKMWAPRFNLTIP